MLGAQSGVVPDAAQRLRLTLEAVPHTPQLRVPQIVLRNRLEEAINAVPHQQLRLEMVNHFAQMLQGQAPHGFRVLQGEPASQHASSARRSAPPWHTRATLLAWHTVALAAS